MAQKVAAGVYKGVTTSELDELAAETAAAMTSTHPDYAIVSAELCLAVTPCCSHFCPSLFFLCLSLRLSVRVPAFAPLTLVAFYLGWDSLPLSWGG